jgi:hypothetical protein
MIGFRIADIFQSFRNPVTEAVLPMCLDDALRGCVVDCCDRRAKELDMLGCTVSDFELLGFKLVAVTVLEIGQVISFLENDRFR